MPELRQTKLAYNNVEKTINNLKDAIYTKIHELEIDAWVSQEPNSYQNRKAGKHTKLHIGSVWGKLFDCAWMNFTGKVPKEVVNKELVLLLDVNGEMCVFNDDGEPIRGLTSTSSIFDPTLGRPTKRVFSFIKKSQGGEDIDIWADCGNNCLFGSLQKGGAIETASLAICNNQARDLFYDMTVLYELADILPKDSARSAKIKRVLQNACYELVSITSQSIAIAKKIIEPELAKTNGSPSLQISACGHAHMDLAWLWPIRETKRKGARTISTSIELIERYPDYVFGISQPQYFQWIKESYPSLYAKVVENVKNKRIEAQGAMWVECDTNVPSGESLVRQILYGKAFYKEEFGVDMDYVWLPDVFGYSASLPQIMKKSDINYFITQKLSWNEINNHPHHSFVWEGNDKSKVLAHLLPENTYNGPAMPRSCRDIEKNYLDKDVSSYALMAFGIGDGGGGPGAEHLEHLKRLKDLNGIAPVKQETVTAFLQKWQSEAENFSTFKGELYLEKHQGTFTTHSRNKWFNRKMELALRELEFLASITNVEYPKQFIEDTWKEVLLYQFHDILPGSSIKRVYDESIARYSSMLEDTQHKILGIKKALISEINAKTQQDSFVIFNTTSFSRNEWLKVDDVWMCPDVPAMGYRVSELTPALIDDQSLKASSDILENNRVKISFNDKGHIVSILNKDIDREFIAESLSANVIKVFHDDGTAWDFAPDYNNFQRGEFVLEKVTAHIDGPKVSVIQEYTYEGSNLLQTISLVQGSARVDFDTILNWTGENKMIRTSFPTNIMSEYATCEIQYGTLNRPTGNNTSLDMAKDEVPVQKYVDLSDNSSGIALLNDSKYGYRVKDGILDLNLLRSMPYTGPMIYKDQVGKDLSGNFGDQGEHKFTYSIYTHAGNHIAGDVAREALKLNIPLTSMAIPKSNVSSSNQIELEKSYFNVDKNNIFIDAVKQSEDTEGKVVRMYEAYGMPTKTVLSFADDVKKLKLINLIECDIKELEIIDNQVELFFKPFEIISIKLI